MKHFSKWQYPTGLELIRYAKQHHKHIRIKQRDYLIKLNYTQKVQAESIWNPFTVMARGIILDSNTGEIIEYPFRKFFNKFEYKKYGIKIPYRLPYEVTLKYDGVMIIPYMYNETLFLSSRGQFQNKYIEKATGIQYFDWLDIDHYTFMFELISPSFSKLQNKSGWLVTKYENEDLILVGMRDKQTNELLMPSEVVKYAEKNNLHCFPLLDLSVEDLLEIYKKKDGNTQEGWVITYQNGFMVKLKRLEHIEYFASIKEITERKVLKLLVSNKYQEFKNNTPKELWNDLERIHNRIIQERDKFIKEVISDFNKIFKEAEMDRKQFFLLVKDFKKYKKGKKKNKAYASALKIFYTKRTKEALYDHFYQYAFSQYRY